MFCKGCGKSIDTAFGACPHCGRPADALSGGTGFWDLLDERPMPDAEQTASATAPLQVPVQAPATATAQMPIIPERPVRPIEARRTVETAANVRPTRILGPSDFLLIGIGFILGIAVTLLITTLAQCSNDDGVEPAPPEATSPDQGTSDPYGTATSTGESEGEDRQEATQSDAQSEAQGDAQGTAQDTTQDDARYGNQGSQSQGAASSEATEGDGTENGTEGDTRTVWPPYGRTDRQQEEEPYYGQ